MLLPAVMMLAMVLFIAICVVIENAAMERRRIRMRRADDSRRAAVDRAERAHLAGVARGSAIKRAATRQPARFATTSLVHRGGSVAFRTRPTLPTQRLA